MTQHRRSEQPSNFAESRKFRKLKPRAGSGAEKIDPLRFLARCRKRRLNQALSVLSVSLDFLSVSVVLLTRATLFALCYFVFRFLVVLFRLSVPFTHSEN